VTCITCSFRPVLTGLAAGQPDADEVRWDLAWSQVQTPRGSMPVLFLIVTMRHTLIGMPPLVLQAPLQSLKADDPGLPELFGRMCGQLRQLRREAASVGNGAGQ
jgi:hypothetical protein